MQGASPGQPIRSETAEHLESMALDKQIADRIPGLAAAVARAGKLVWSTGIGAADLDAPATAPDADTQYEVASNTKTFVAATIMALRDEGALSLDDTIGTLLPELAHGDVTIRQMLAHVSGMQREMPGDVWDTLQFPDREQLVAGWNAAERILRPHYRWHYSNLSYGMLGELITQLDGGDWFASVRRRFLEPLGLTRTTIGLTGRHAVGYYVPPWTDVPVREPHLAPNALSSAGGIASTLTDMATWHGFLADPDPAVLAPDTVAEMLEPQILADRTGWSLAWGLGLEIVRRGDRTWFGHTGGHPGFITGVFTDRESKTTGLMFANQSMTTAAESFPVDLAAYVVEHDPARPEPWRPGTDVPAEFASMLGRWFSEGRPFVVTVAEGRLEIRLEIGPGLPTTQPPARFERVDADVYRTVEGRETGELLRLHRDADGQVTRMHWATYLFTREPYAFGEWLTDDTPAT